MKAKKEAEAKEPPPPPDRSKKKKPKRKKDPTEKFSVESLYIELVTNGIMQVCPKRTFDEYISEDWLRGVEQDPIKAWLLDNSMAQVEFSSLLKFLEQLNVYVTATNIRSTKD